MRNGRKTALTMLIALALTSASAPVLAEAQHPASVLEFSWVWYELYGLYSGAIDNYNNANYSELSELTDAGIPFIAASEMEELNKEHLDGRFEGNLPYSGYAAFVEKNRRENRIRV